VRLPHTSLLPLHLLQAQQQQQPPQQQQPQG
jgi:hypothetical protein